MKFAYIALFGVLGVFARYFLGLELSKIVPSSFPVGTLAINLLGSFLIGIIFVLGAERTLVSEDLRIGLMVGFLGGFTTFSSYCLEVVRLFEKADFANALIYFAASNFFGLMACFFGMFVARII